MWRWLDLFDDLMTSQSIEGESFPDFEMLDARIASALRKIISSTSFRRRATAELQRAQKYNRFLRERRIALMTHGHFQSTGAYDAARVCRICSIFACDVQDFDTRWGQILLGTSEMAPENVLEAKTICKVLNSFKQYLL